MERVWLARLRLSHIPSEAILDFLADFCLCFLAGDSLVSSWPFGWLFSLSLSLASDGSTLRPFRNFCFNCSFHEPCIHCNKIQCEWQIFKCKKNGRTVVAKPERLGNCTPFSIPITSCVCNTNTYNFVAEFISKNWIFVHQSLTSCPVLGRSRPANLATPKTLRLGCLVGGAPIELLASHTHCMKIDDSEWEVASILACVACKPVYARFSVMNMQPSSAVSKIRWQFPTPSRIFRSLR